ncbi:hypothetical protein [Streptomyces griseorubiginosus]|uniref:hypothetical protein n=1 Tax=Streptomyces griseorubiginosus TaxID=67304 RepID=UPI0036679067
MLGDLVKAGAKAMGGTRFSLVNVLPGTLVVAVTAALIRAHAYEFDQAVQMKDVLPGKDDAVSVVVFALAALVGGILLRPFERALVQQLEGYWNSPSPLAPLRAAAVELHRRRRNDAVGRVWTAEPAQVPAGPATLDSLLAHDRRAARQARRQKRDIQIQYSYPDDGMANLPGRESSSTDLMPTLLGNVLRRAERMAGGRYGLDAMVVYPRLYPYISERLADAMARQLELLAVTASLSVSFGLLGATTAPLLGRGDVWSLTPVAAVVLSALAYRGAVVTAGYTGILFNTVFDLHRFDLTSALRYKLPDTAAEEFALNQRLTRYLNKQDTHTLKDTAGLNRIGFAHPDEPQPVAGQPLVPPAGDSAGSA